MPGRILTPEQQKEALDILGDIKTLDVDRVCKCFAYSKKHGGIRFYVDDIITIGPEQSPFVAPNSKTTLGIYIQNKYLYEDLGIFGYVNKTISGKVDGKVNSAMAKALMAGDITREQYGEYIDRCQYLFGGPLAFIINTSMSETILSLPSAARQQRDSLLKENKEGIERNDPSVSSSIEKKVVTTALEEMRKKNDPAIAMFDSGCGVDPYNNYRTMFVMKGAISDNTGESPSGYKIVTSSYDDGISKDDMPKIADSLVTTAYARGVSTQDSGTNAKKYNVYFQRIRIQPRGSDCKTTQYLDQIITADNAEDMMYRYILDNGKLVMLDKDNIESYYGKTVKMRSGIYCKCKDPEYCSICVGDRPYRIGIKNIGLTFNIVSGSTLNSSMKKFHDVSIKTFRLSANDLMKYVK